LKPDRVTTVGDVQRRETMPEGVEADPLPGDAFAVRDCNEISQRIAV